MQKILFVCTGNTCRSPLAHVLAQKHFDDNGLDLIADSGGVFAADGASASAHSVSVAKKLGLDLAGHKAKKISREIIHEAAVVVCLTMGHKAHLVENYPEHTGKIFTFGELSEDCGDVSDPFGGDFAIYEKCAAQIKLYIEKILWRKMV